MGPAAVLHCLRIAAMLARVMPSPTTLDLLGAFLHDKEEDLTREELGPAEWDRVQSEFARVLEKIDSNHRWFLGERIALLWRQSSQSYYDYVGTVLSKVRTMPDLLRCKLADRLDNTLDIAVQRTPTEQNAFFEMAFGMLFLPGYQPASNDWARCPRCGSVRAAHLAAFQERRAHEHAAPAGLDHLDDTTTRLFHASPPPAASKRSGPWLACSLRRRSAGRTGEVSCAR
jgi:hypothetical protein